MRGRRGGRFRRRPPCPSRRRRPGPGAGARLRRPSPSPPPVPARPGCRCAARQLPRPRPPAGGAAPTGRPRFSEQCFRSRVPVAFEWRGRRERDSGRAARWGWLPGLAACCVWFSSDSYWNRTRKRKDKRKKPNTNTTESQTTRHESKSKTKSFPLRPFVLHILYFSFGGLSDESHGGAIIQTSRQPTCPFGFFPSLLNRSAHSAGLKRILKAW